MALRTTTPASTKVFGIDIAGTLSSAISSAGGVTPAVLIKRTPRHTHQRRPRGRNERDRDPHPCQAIVDGGGAGAAITLITLLGASIISRARGSFPRPATRSRCAGDDGDRRAPEADPAAAEHHLPGRGRGAGAAVTLALAIVARRPWWHRMLDALPWRRRPLQPVAQV